MYYQIPVIDGAGHVVQKLPVERNIRKSSNGMTGIFAKLCFKKKSRADIVKLVATGDLVPAQLVQIKSAIEKGLTEMQLIELINNNISAEKMKEIIEIAVLENSMADEEELMNLAVVNEAVTEMNGVEHKFTEDEKNFVVQFAFRSGSKEDTISLVEALAHSSDKTESNEIMVTYRAKYDMKPAWVEQVENLLVALEMYRIEEEKAINHLADILTAYGIDVSADEIRSTETEVLKTTVREKVEVR